MALQNPVNNFLATPGWNCLSRDKTPSLTGNQLSRGLWPYWNLHPMPMVKIVASYALPNA